ncbi:hypothetical protein [Pontibacter harenae]|uniref:hypothetical protein n=1 Tax=Pontibacter harenae TaxID=2894083 RepID=UPI001E5B9C1A|nr:hypothetical protein [Pontibacter harenae]MCC9167973.1 hypothetical protein [Pontibacter harenae]
MDVQEFNSLALDERVAAVWRQGTFLGSRTRGGYRLALYHLGAFFCELWYCPKSNGIVLASGFTDTRLLEAYLGGIELPNV